jgi:hypothetical protein
LPRASPGRKGEKGRWSPRTPRDFSPASLPPGLRPQPDKSTLHPIGRVVCRDFGGGGDPPVIHTLSKAIPPQPHEFFSNGRRRLLYPAGGGSADDNENRSLSSLAVPRRMYRSERVDSTKGARAGCCGGGGMARGRRREDAGHWGVDGNRRDEPRMSQHALETLGVPEPIGHPWRPPAEGNDRNTAGNDCQCRSEIFGDNHANGTEKLVGIVRTTEGSHLPRLSIWRMLLIVA